MKIDTHKRLIDTQPAFDALAELQDQSGLCNAETKRYLAAKILDSIRDMRETAEHLEKRLSELNILPKEKTARGT
jgi:hypothetical protein